MQPPPAYLLQALQELPRLRHHVAPQREIQALAAAIRAYHWLGEDAAAGRLFEEAARRVPALPGERLQAMAHLELARTGQVLGLRQAVRSHLQQGQRQGLALPPRHRAEMWPELARLWAALGETQPLWDLWQDLQTWDDPWLQVPAWRGLLATALEQQDAQGMAYALDVLWAWDAPFLLQAVREAGDLLAHPAARPVLLALSDRAPNLPEPFYRGMLLVALARHWRGLGEDERAARLLHAARAVQEHLSHPARRAEHMAALGRALAEWPEAHAEARRFLYQALDLARGIGYMDDRARVLHPVLDGLVDLGDHAGLLQARPVIEEIGYPRFYGPLARHLAQALLALGDRATARDVSLQAVHRARAEAHVWKQAELLRHAVGVPLPEVLAEAMALAGRLPDERYRGQALVDVAAALPSPQAETHFPRLWEQALALRLPGPRQGTVLRLLEIGLEKLPRWMFTRGSQALAALQYPHWRALALERLAQAWRQAQESKP